MRWFQLITKQIMCSFHSLFVCDLVLQCLSDSNTCFTYNCVCFGRVKLATLVRGLQRRRRIGETMIGEMMGRTAGIAGIMMMAGDLGT